jgi:hypothetical protein
MVLGGVVPILAVAVGLAADPPIEILVAAGIIGIPLGIILGSVHGIAAREADGIEAFDLALRMAVQAVVAGDLVLAVIATIGVSTVAPWLVMGIVVPIAGLLILGLPALAFTIVCTLLWMAALRALPSRLVGDAPVSHR